MSRRTRRLCVAAATLAPLTFACAGAAPAPQPVNTSSQAPLREYASGSGPTAIFRLGRVGDRDVFGVVDPILWRIHFYALEVLGPRSGSKLLKDRLAPAGDCALPPAFRVWRVHHRGDAVILQSQPAVTEATLPAAGRDPFKTKKLTLKADRSSLRSKIDKPFTDNNELPSNACGEIRDFASERDSTVRVTGGDKTAFTVTPLTGNPNTFGGRFTLPRLGSQRSVQALEEARSDTNKTLRHFIVTSRSANHPGFATSEVRIVRRGEDKALDRIMRLNIGLMRVKSGLRFAAIGSTGEILLVGASDHNFFYFHTCSFDPPRSARRCAVEAEPQDPSTNAESEGDKSKERPAQPPTRERLWKKAHWYTSQRYKIDISNRPEDCNDWKGCVVNGRAWQPISELRFAPQVSTKVGVPYAQNGGGRFQPVMSEKTTADFAEPLPLYRRSAAGFDMFVSDIENTSLKAIKDGTGVFCIDCSALLSELWGRGTTSTQAFRDHANDNEVERKREFGSLLMGDALLINLADTIAHVVIFREVRKASSQDSSEVVLVVESSSSCGGACWSYYDESFFHGWAIIGSGNGGNTPSDFKSIPTTHSEWKQRFAIIQ